MDGCTLLPTAEAEAAAAAVEATEVNALCLVLEGKPGKDAALPWRARAPQERCVHACAREGAFTPTD